jgi:hypothetical protein
MRKRKRGELGVRGMQRRREREARLVSSSGTGELGMASKGQRPTRERWRRSSTRERWIRHGLVNVDDGYGSWEGGAEQEEQQRRKNLKK